jgi:hypothetical protein
VQYSPVYIISLPFADEKIYRLHSAWKNGQGQTLPTAINNALMASMANEYDLTQVGSFYLQPPTSNSLTSDPTSHRTQTSDPQHPTSDPEPPTSILQPPTPNLTHTTSNLTPPTPNLELLTPNLRPPTKFKPPTSNLQPNLPPPPILTGRSRS